MQSHRKHMTFVSPLVGAVLALGVAACGQPQPDAQGGGLREVTIPADFTFSTTKKGVVSISVSEALVAESAVVEVKRADGATVFWGSVTPAKPTDITALLPKHHDAVEVSLHRQDMPSITETVTLQDGVGAHRFQ